MAAGGGALLAALAPAFATAPDGEGGTDAAPGGDRQCFFARQVTGFRNVEDEEGRRDDTRVLVDVGARDTYEFELMRRCPGLRFARSVALVRQGPGRFCDGLDAGMIWVNSENVRHLPTPFGGTKASGIGRDGGDWSFDFYMETKNIAIATGEHKISKLGN